MKNILIGLFLFGLLALMKSAGVIKISWWWIGTPALILLLSTIGMAVLAGLIMHKYKKKKD